jgi:hypothetical protein
VTQRGSRERMHPREMKSPHVVILGAGASKACCPDGDANGLLVPLTDELPRVPGIAEILAECGVLWRRGQKFEDTYDRLYKEGIHAAQLAEMERRLHEYLTQLRLPDALTVYDKLLLALTPNDLVATFNWDPLLLHAFRRSQIAGAAPKLAFLHGCVDVGVCSTHNQIGYQDRSCPACGGPLGPTKLLYPISDKDYDENPVIRDQWAAFDHHLENAYFVTIFGYSAPVNDSKAISRMEQLWSRNRRGNLLQVEFVVEPGTACRRQVAEKWADFLVGEHFDVCDKFERSWLSRCPRRTCVALWQTAQNNDWYYPDNPFPECSGVEELKAWVRPLIDEENDVNFRVERWHRCFGGLPPESNERTNALASTMRTDFLLDASKPGSVAWSCIIIRSSEHDTYPEPDPDGHKGISSWFKVDLLGFYDAGIEVRLSDATIAFHADDSWCLMTADTPADASRRTEDVFVVGRIPFTNVASYDLRPDDWYGEPRLFCRFCIDGAPYESIRYARGVRETPEGLILDGPLDSANMRALADDSGNMIEDT